MTAAATSASGLRDRRNFFLFTTAAALFLVLYFPVIVKLAGQWLTDSNYRHGIVIPFVSAFILWKRRRLLRESITGGGELWGLLLIGSAAVLLIVGTAASELFTARLSIPLFLMGASLYLAGKRFTAEAAFPLAFLFLMIPLPYVIYYKITFPLQLMSARLSAAVLTIVRVNVIRKGNILLLPNYALEVVAACSGLRSMMTMLTLGLILAFFSDLSMTRKVILVASTVPAAIGANTIRLTITALGAYTVGPEFADGTLHQLSGLIVFCAGFIFLLIVAGVLKWVK